MASNNATVFPLAAGSRATRGCEPLEVREQTIRCDVQLVFRHIRPVLDGATDIDDATGLVFRQFGEATENSGELSDPPTQRER